MTLQTPQPPPSALRAALAALDSEAALQQPAAAALRHPAGPLLPAHPLALHVLDGPGVDVSAAPRIGWRFMIKCGLAGGASLVAAAVEVVETPDGHAFSHFTAGPYLDSTVRALRQAWQLARSSRAPHQPRLLSIPGHYAMALWLHSPGEETLLPLAPAPCGITAHRAYPAADLLALLERAPFKNALVLGLS